MEKKKSNIINYVFGSFRITFYSALLPDKWKLTLSDSWIFIEKNYLQLYSYKLSVRKYIQKRFFNIKYDFFQSMYLNFQRD